MKISLIGPVYPYRGGIAHYTASLATALGNAGHDVRVFSFKRQYPAFLYPGDTDKDPSSDPLRVNAAYILDPLYPWTWRQTALAILKTEPDLVLFQWWTTFWGPAFAGLAYQLRNKVQMACLIHNVLPHENRFWDRWLARLALSQISAFIVQAPNEKKKLQALLPSAKMSYCGHPVYQRFSEQIISKETARQKLDLPADKRVFLFFGIVRPYKGLRILIEALAHTKAPIHLIIAGEFWEDVEHYKNWIADLGLRERIKLLNKYLPNEEAHIVFSAADALVAPYIGGTQSGVAELALGYSLPAIVTDRISAGITETNIPLKIVPVGNVPALTNAMDEFAQTPLTRISAIESVEKSWEQMVKTIQNIQSGF